MTIALKSMYPTINKCIISNLVAISADPDQTAPNGAVWSEATLFACEFRIQSFSIITL